MDVPGLFLSYRAASRRRDAVLPNGGTAGLRMWHPPVAWPAQIARVTSLDYRALQAHIVGISKKAYVLATRRCLDWTA